VLAGRNGSADPDAAMFDDDDEDLGAGAGGSRLLSERSHIRKNFDVEDISEEYRGRVVSRKQLDFGGGQQEDDEEEEEEDDDGENAEEEEEEDEQDDEEEEEEGEDDDEDGEDEDDENEEDEDDEEGGGTKAMLASGLSDQQRQVQQQLAALEAEDAAGAGGAASLFQPRGAAASTGKGKTAPSSATSQYTKSLHMQNQLSWYTQLLNLRIRVQGVVAAANRLPAAADVSVADQAPSADAVDAVSVRQRFEAAAPAVAPAYSATLRGARKLLDELFDLQHELMQQNARLFAAGAGATEDEDEQEDEEEEEAGSRSRIPRWQGLAGSKRRRATSEDETEAASNDEEEGASNGHGVITDEQAAVDQYWRYLSGSLTPFFRPIQDALIDKWNTKTQLSAGQVAGGAGAGSSAFGQSGLAAAASAGGKGGLKVINQSVLAQIDQLMLDESRLVRRSQLHRGANASSDAKNALLGRVEAERTRAAKRARRETAAVSDFDAAELAANGGGDAEDEEQYDGAIYDDNDYYQQLLAEIIAAASSSELGSGGVGGPAGGHDAAQLAKAAAAARKRGKRAGAGVVDRRASKGRKMRYVVHAKLANFMAPRAAPIADDYATRKAAAAAGAGSAAAALTGSGFALDELFINLFGGHGKKTLTAAAQKSQAAAQ